MSRGSITAGTVRPFRLVWTRWLSFLGGLAAVSRRLCWDSSPRLLHKGPQVSSAHMHTQGTQVLTYTHRTGLVTHTHTCTHTGTWAHVSLQHIHKHTHTNP
jgi:hypothetical protein